MTHWSRIFVDRPVAMLMIVAAVVVFGWTSLRQMPVDLMPDVSYPTITVRGTYAGAAPLEVEREIVEPLEQVLRTVEGVRHVESVSRPGYAEIYLQFRWGSNLDIATQRVRERLALVELRDGIAPPKILRYDPALDAVFRVALSGRGTETLGQYARDELAPALSSVPGVALVRVRGGSQTLLRVEVDPDALARHRLNIERIEERLRAENLSLVGGRLNDHGREVLIRTDNTLTSIEELRALVLQKTGDAYVRLEHVANIERVVERPETYTTWNGQSSVELDVFREADANLIEVVDALNDRLFKGTNALAQQLPPQMELAVSQDGSRYVRAAIQEVQSNAMMGALCAIVVLLLFLRSLYPTFVISLAIPLSVIATFAPMLWSGITLNIMSLGGLALGVGMVVDNAVVILEAIYRRTELGDAPREASLQGTKEVGGAVIASTFTTVVVFAPIIFMQGIASLFFKDLGVTVALALFASLAFSLAFVPTLLALRGRRQTSSRPQPADEATKEGWRSLALYQEDQERFQRYREAQSSVFKAFLYLLTPIFWLYRVLRTAVALPFEALFKLLSATVITGLGAVLKQLRLRLRRENPHTPDATPPPKNQRYRQTIAWVLDHTWGVWCAIIALFVAAWFSWPRLGVELIPAQEEDSFFVRLAFEPATPLEEVAMQSAQIERRIAGIEGVAATASSAGDEERGQQRERSAVHISQVRVQLTTSKNTAQHYAQVVQKLRDVLQDVPSVEWSVEESRIVSAGAPLRIEVIGQDVETLRISADQVAHMLASLDGVVDVRNHQQQGNDELVVRLRDDRLAAYGLSAEDVASNVRAMTRGVTSTTLRAGGERLEVNVRAPEQTSIEALKAMPIALPATPFGEAQSRSRMPSIGGVALDQALRSSAGDTALQARAVRLDAIADFDVSRGPSEIRHVRGRRAAIVEAGADVRDIGGLSALVHQRLQDMEFPDGGYAQLVGQTEEIEAARANLLFAFLLAVFLVYAVMASLFESFIGPLLIMITIPLALAAVILGLAVMGFPLSVVVLIGAIVLVGIVVNNAIVLVDTMLQLEREGMARKDAIVHASSIRLRPVAITATTTILGLVPMLLAQGEGAQIRQPLALVLVVGLSVSTVLTLVVIPVFYQRFMPRVTPDGRSFPLPDA